MARRAFSCAALLDLSGVYVINFPDRVKVGYTLHTRLRLVQHLNAGALDATVFELSPSWQKRSPAPPLRELERLAIGTLEQLGTPVGREEFTGIDYRSAVQAVRNLNRHAREVDFRNLPALREAISPSGTWPARREPVEVQ